MYFIASEEKMKDSNAKFTVKNEKEKREINLLPLLFVLLRKAWLIILVGIVCAGLLYGFAKLFVIPTYMCGFTAYVNNQHVQANKDTLTNSDLAASQHLTKTYNYILKSNSILDAALETAASELSRGQLRKMIKTEIQEDTEVISLYVISESPQEAYDLAVAIAKVAPSYMSEIIEGSSMKIVDYPVYSDSRYKPDYSKYAIAGFFAGALAVIIILSILYFVDDTIKSEDEVEQAFSVPILGIIPDMMDSEHGGSYYYYYKKDKDKEIREDDNNEKKEMVENG